MDRSFVNRNDVFARENLLHPPPPPPPPSAQKKPPKSFNNSNNNNMSVEFSQHSASLHILPILRSLIIFSCHHVISVSFNLQILEWD